LTIPASTGARNGQLLLTVQTQVINSLPDTVTQIVNIDKKPGTPDPACPSNQCVIIPAQKPKLLLVKTGTYEDTDNSGSPTPGDIPYTSRITNNSSSSSAGLMVVDTAPPPVSGLWKTRQRSMVQLSHQLLKAGLSSLKICSCLPMHSLKSACVCLH